MRILHVADYSLTGLGYQEAYLAREQSRAGHQVFVLTSDRQLKSLLENTGGSDLGKIQEGGLQELDREGVLVHQLPTLLEINGRVWMSGLESRLLELRPDAIHVHCFVTATAVRVALMHLRNPLLKSATLLIDDHMYPQVSKSRLKVAYPLVRALATPILHRSADWIVAVSTATRDFMKQNYGLTENDIQIIRLGVDPDLFRPDPVTRQFMREKIGFSNDDIVFIYTGKFIPRKQIDVLLTAASQLSHQYPQMRLLFVGYGSENYLTELRELSAELSLKNRLSWQPVATQHELARYFAAADVAVWPGEHSISFLEAMSSGLPLVVGDTPKASEEVAYENGFAFPLGDATALASYMRLLLTSPDLRYRMGAAGRKAVETHSTWASISEQFVNCYMHPKCIR